MLFTNHTYKESAWYSSLYL